MESFPFSSLFLFRFPFKLLVFTWFSIIFENGVRSFNYYFSWLITKPVERKAASIRPNESSFSNSFFLSKKCIFQIDFLFYFNIPGSYINWLDLIILEWQSLPSSLARDYHEVFLHYGKGDQTLQLIQGEEDFLKEKSSKYHTFVW